MELRFDLIDAMSQLKKKFGEDSSLFIFNDGENLIVRLNVKDCHTQFALTRHDIDDCLVSTANLKFKQALEFLDYFIAKKKEVLNEANEA